VKVTEEAIERAKAILDLEKKVKFCLKFNICPECAGDLVTRLLPVSEDNITAKGHSFVCDACGFIMSMKKANELRSE
jgi:predicted RNA-binding Zn-ribbon protein involved in translation (DUF1610 family)